jgi:hypothetical protein
MKTSQLHVLCEGESPLISHIDDGHVEKIDLVHRTVLYVKNKEPKVFTIAEFLDFLPAYVKKDYQILEPFTKEMDGPSKGREILVLPPEALLQQGPNADCFVAKKPYPVGDYLRRDGNLYEVKYYEKIGSNFLIQIKTVGVHDFSASKVGKDDIITQLEHWHDLIIERVDGEPRLFTGKEFFCNHFDEAMALVGTVENLTENEVVACAYGFEKDIFTDDWYQW